MDMRYQEYCFADPHFYDHSRGTAGDRNSFLSGHALPDGWLSGEKNVWTMIARADSVLPMQGWKVHVSAGLDNAKEILDRVWTYCIDRGIAFKFLTTKSALVARNSKYADRGGSGKFITIYPVGDDQLRSLVEDLAAALEGQPGPYILSDVRIGSGPLHVRYGGFAERFVRSELGEPIYAIEDPDGNLVEDPRRPIFELPEWAPVPEFLTPHLTARETDDDSLDFPYDVKEPLHFSNGGGIYRAVDKRNDREVVLREARPHAGLDSGGRDAVQRVRRESDMLEKLAGLPCVPEVYDIFTCWEHLFLSEEYIEGNTLGKEIVARYPLIRPARDEQKVREFTEWAVDLLSRVRAGLDAIHERGVTFGDLHPHNILVQPDGEIRFVDFEAASLHDEQQKATMGAPGYVAPDGRTGPALDHYAMACLRISAFLPLNAILPLDPSKIRTIVAIIEQMFPVPEGFTDTIFAELNLPAGDTGDRRLATVISGLGMSAEQNADFHRSLIRGILASATPDRPDRLYPGDIKQFTDDALGLAWGAAGVLHTLHSADADLPDEQVQWLIDAALRSGPEQRIGLYNGLHGVAYTLEEIGRPDPARAILERAAQRDLDELPTTLYGGLAGVGLNLLHFSDRTGDRRYYRQALNVADRLSELVTKPLAEPAPDRRRQNGLLHGASGRALFFLRLYEKAPSSRLLELAELELGRDLDQCVETEDGTMQLDEGWRIMPYLESGSAGIALVLDQYLTHRPNDRFDRAIDLIRRATEPEFVICPGLFNGRAGLLALLTQLRDSGRRPATQLAPTIDRLVRRLSWHAVRHGNDITFPGDQLLRKSMDLGTGAAGILLALRAAEGHGLDLPLIVEPASARQRRSIEPAILPVTAR